MKWYTIKHECLDTETILPACRRLLFPLLQKQYCVMKQWFSSEYRICKHFRREFRRLGDWDNALLSNRLVGSRGSNQKLSMTSDGVVPG